MINNNELPPNLMFTYKLKHLLSVYCHFTKIYINNLFIDWHIYRKMNKTKFPIFLEDRSKLSIPLLLCYV